MCETTLLQYNFWNYQIKYVHTGMWSMSWSNLNGLVMQSNRENEWTLWVIFSGSEVQPHGIWAIMCPSMVNHGRFCKYRRLDSWHTCEQRFFHNNCSKGKQITIMFLIFFHTFPTTVQLLYLCSIIFILFLAQRLQLTA